MTNLKIRNILISDLELFLIKGASCEENENCFLYKRVSNTREPTAFSQFSIRIADYPVISIYHHCYEREGGEPQNKAKLAEVFQDFGRRCRS